MSGLDTPKGVREGEELDVASLEAWLTQNTDIKTPIEVQQFPSGHSNLTYFIKDASEKEHVLRRPPFGANVKSGHDMSREFNVLTKLADFPKTPEAIAYCDDDAVIGASFYLMERVSGVILRGPSPRGVELPEDTMHKVCRAFVDTFVEIHNVDIEATGIIDMGKPDGYVERQVSGWTRRYGKAKTDDLPGMETAATWLADNLPPQSAATLIHNDFKYDNMVLDPDDLGRVKAVLDWEMATVGDPLMDFGSTLGYWVEASDPEFLQAVSGPTALPGNLTRQELVEAYAEASGRSIDHILFYYVYGLFKLGVIGQQIYYRYKHGFTQDERFAGLIFLVQAVSERAVQAIETNKI